MVIKLPYLEAKIYFENYHRKLLGNIFYGLIYIFYYIIL